MSLQHRLSMGLRKSSISSRDISDPQAYRTSEDTIDETSTPIPSRRQSKRQSSALKPRPVSAVIQPTQYKPGLWLYLAFATLGILTIMVALDATALSVALPIIAKALHGSGLEAFWAATSYLLTSTVFQPTIAALSNTFGRKWITTGSVLMFLFGILLAGLAHNFTLLLAGRTVQGIGGGGIVVLTQVIICDLVPLRLRGQWFGVISGMYAIGSVSGPLLGGVFSERVSWRWIFWINLPFTGAGLIMIPLFIRLGVPKSTFFRKLADIDWTGSVIFIASTTGFLIPLSWGGVSYPWSSWRVVAPFSISTMGLVLLYVYEERVAKNPIIRTSIFKNRNAAIAYICVVIHGMVVVGSLYYLPLYYEAVKGLSPIVSGVALFPETFTVAPGAFTVGFLISRTGHYRWAVWAGWVITTLGLGFLYLLDVNTTTVQWIMMNLVVGVGLGFNYSALGVVLQAATSEEDMSSAVAMFTFFRLFGQAIGVVIGGVVFQNQIKSKLLEAPPNLAAMAEEYASDGSALAQLIINLPPTPSKVILVQAYADSLKMFWIVLTAISATALFVSLWMKRHSLDREFVSPQQLGGDRDDVALIAERGTQDSLSETSQGQGLGEKPDDPPSYEAGTAPIRRTVSFAENDALSVRGRQLSPRRQELSGLSPRKRASSEYSVPIDALEVPARARVRSAGEANLMPPERPWTQLHDIREHTPLAEMTTDPFNNVMRRGGVRNSAHLNTEVGQSNNRDSVMSQSSNRNSWLGQWRLSRSGGEARPISWAPVYGMG